MSAPTGVVLVATALVSSPVLWLVHEGSLSTGDALVRGLLCLAVCRVAISVVSAVAYPTVRPQVPTADGGTGSPRTADAAAPGQPPTATEAEPR